MQELGGWVTFRGDRSWAVRQHRVRGRGRTPGPQPISRSSTTMASQGRQPKEFLRQQFRWTPSWKTFGNSSWINTQTATKAHQHCQPESHHKIFEIRYPNSMSIVPILCGGGDEMLWIAYLPATFKMQQQAFDAPLHFDLCVPVYTISMTPSLFIQLSKCICWPSFYVP